MMRKTELEDCPQWLLDAETEGEDVSLVDGSVVWFYGTWKSGTWLNGTWKYGIWLNGIWANGTWNNGTWHDGTWNNGTWHDGTWVNGTWGNGSWMDGVWYQGTWNNGTWHDGTWNNGTWHDGTWGNGSWESGIWHDGRWYTGVWHNGQWYNGQWDSGTWHNGTWKRGTWTSGIWKQNIDRLLLMASSIGIVFRDGYAIAYRTTQKDGHGRYTKKFIQPEGEWYEKDFSPKGYGVCCQGIHVGSIQTALMYFGYDPDMQLWEVKFKQEDLLDCDGLKARIRGGVFTRIDNPFEIK